MLSKLSKLQLDPYVNVILYGGEILENIELQKNRDTYFTQIGLCNRELTVSNHKCQTSIWKVNHTSDSGKRYFFRDQIDHAIIVLNLRTDGSKTLLQHLAALTTLCSKQLPTTIIGVFQEESDCQRHKIAKQHLVEVVKLVLKESERAVEPIEFKQINISNQLVVEQTIKKIAEQVIEQRKQELLKQAQALLENKLSI